MKGGIIALAALFLDVRTVTAPAAAPILIALLLLMPLFFLGTSFFASSFGLAMMLSFISNRIGNAVFRSALVYTLAMKSESIQKLQFINQF
jgi:hypothetical protein